MGNRFSMSERESCIFAGRKLRDKQETETMVNRMDKDKMDQVRKCLWMVMSTFRGMNKNATLFVATLLYFRKLNGLSVISENNMVKNEKGLCHAEPLERLCYDHDIVENEKNEKFRSLLERTLSEFEEYFKGHLVPVVEFVHALVEYEFTEKELLSIFDLAIDDSLQIGESYIPKELSELVEFLVDKDSKKILDPFGGRMVFATTLMDKSFISFETDEWNWEIGMFRLAIAGVLEHNKNIYLEGFLSDVNDKFDAIVTMPPFGITGASHEYLDEWALGRFDKLTNEHGQLVTIVPMSVLFRGSKMQVDGPNTKITTIRRDITKNNWLESVIYLPYNIFPTTGVAAVVVVLRKNRKENDKVRFIDASDCFTTKNRLNVIDLETIISRYDNCENLISLDEILRNNSSWDLRWYVEQKKNVFGEGYTVVKVCDVMTQLPTVSKFEDKSGYVVNVGDLSDDVINYEKKTEMFTKGDNLERTSKVVEPVILLSMIRSPKPTYCEASESNPIFIKNDVVAYRITNSSIYPGFLCMELAKRLKAYTGAIIPRLSKYQVLNALIEFPSLDEQRSFVEQKNLFEEAKKTAQMAKVNELGLREVIESMKNEYSKSIHARKHAISQNLSAFSALWNTLYRFKNQNDGRLFDTDIVSKSYNRSVADVFDALNERLKVILLQADHIADDEPEWGQTEEIEPDAFIEEFIKTHSDIRFEYIHEGYNDEEYNNTLKEIEMEYWAKIVFPPKALLRVFENIVSNAVVHGFTDPDRKDYKILISQQLVDVNCWIITVSNNGESISDGFDVQKTFEYGYTTKSSEGHSGIGAYQIDELMKKFGGSVEIISTPEDLYTVTYVLKFNGVNV